MKNSKIDPAQKAALEIIKKVRAGEYLQAALDAFLKKSGFLKNQARQLADLLYGYFRFQLRTYFILKNFLINPQNYHRTLFYCLAWLLPPCLLSTQSPSTPL